MIQVENIRKSYGQTPVLRGLSLEARAGEITLLVGANGAGKSTTMKLMAGLLRPEAGRVRLDGRDFARDRLAAQGRLSYLPQNPAFHPHFTGRQILEFYADLRGVGPARIAHALASTGLEGVAGQPTGTLSGGLRQRLGLAVLLLPDAPILLLDEPGLSLDPSWRLRLQEVLRAEARRGKTVFVTTHLIAEWNQVAQRCLLCQEGRLARELDPANLLVEAVAFDLAAPPPAPLQPAWGEVWA